MERKKNSCKLRRTQRPKEFDALLSVSSQCQRRVLWRFGTVEENPIYVNTSTPVLVLSTSCLREGCLRSIFGFPLCGRTVIHKGRYRVYTAKSFHLCSSNYELTPKQTSTNCTVHVTSNVKSKNLWMTQQFSNIWKIFTMISIMLLNHESAAEVDTVNAECINMLLNRCLQIFVSFSIIIFRLCCFIWFIVQRYMWSIKLNNEINTNESFGLWSISLLSSFNLWSILLPMQLPSQLLPIDFSSPSLQTLGSPLTSNGPKLQEAWTTYLWLFEKHYVQCLKLMVNWILEHFGQSYAGFSIRWLTRTWQ